MWQSWLIWQHDAAGTLEKEYWNGDQDKWLPSWVIDRLWPLDKPTSGPRWKPRGTPIFLK